MLFEPLFELNRLDESLIFIFLKKMNQRLLKLEQQENVWLIFRKILSSRKDPTRDYQNYKCPSAL